MRLRRDNRFTMSERSFVHLLAIRHSRVIVVDVWPTLSAIAKLSSTEGYSGHWETDSASWDRLRPPKSLGRRAVSLRRSAPGRFRHLGFLAISGIWAC
jgi:hypothetical protein